MSEQSKSFFVQALDALKRGDRRSAAALIERQIRHGNTSAKNLDSVAQLAEHIGEVGLAIEATRLAVVPGAIDSLLAYWARLATHGRAAEAQKLVERQPAAIRDHPVVLHFQGNVATQFGRVEEAEDLFRRALARAPEAMSTWFSLAMIKTFKADDPDIAALERLSRQAGTSNEAKASVHYALGKAAEDCGDPGRAFAEYSKGAALRRPQRPFDAERFRAAVTTIIAQFSSEEMAQLKPSGMAGRRALFVTGLPRSGTTLTEQILLGHSAVTDGAELNLFRSALIPLLGVRMPQALAYQQRHSEHLDPWGEIGHDYSDLLDKRFPSPGLIVDKSLGQSLLTGILLHTLPEAQIAWLRRSPEDVALSCFRTYFTTGLPWSDTLADIAEYMRGEDRLFEHWRRLFPERILAVPYEELVRSPAAWTIRLQDHFGLPFETNLETAAREERAINTASVVQARQPISTSRIGRSAMFEQHLKPFRDHYFG
jgi:tetratricopeptide (TPR) repeat protein